MKTLIITIFLLTLQAANACLWVRGSTVDGKAISYIEEPDWVPIDMLKDSIATDPKRKIEEIGPPEDTQTEAVILILEGKPKEAIPILLEIERKSPGEYGVASNLGTAYELAGDNEAALKWIETSIQRNPRAHFGSEWLHKNILETKVSKTPIPIIDITENLGPDSQTAIKGSSRDLREIRKAIGYQLRERTLLVKPPDKIVGEMFATYAHIQAKTRAVEEAIPLQELALLYDPTNPNLQKTLQEFKAAKAKRVIKDWVFTGVIATVVILLLKKAIEGGRRKKNASIVAKKLGVKLPSQLQKYLLKKGQLTVGTTELYGIGAVPDHLDIVKNNLWERQATPNLPPHLITVWNDGAGNNYCIAPDNSVVLWDHEGDENQTPTPIAPSFTSWIKQLKETGQLPTESPSEPATLVVEENLLAINTKNTHVIIQTDGSSTHLEIGNQRRSGYGEVTLTLKGGNCLEIGIGQELANLVGSSTLQFEIQKEDLPKIEPWLKKLKNRHKTQ